MSLKIVAAQINIWVGDVSGNAQRVIEAAKKARDEHAADVVVFPEMTLLGYPPDDLVLRSGMPASINAGLESVRAASDGIYIIIGHPEYTGDGMLNAASVFYNGELITRARKQLLPNYGVFDEKRHFKAGRETCMLMIKNVPMAICICEDVWGPAPIARAKSKGALGVIALNASPFTQDKHLRRRAVLHARIAENALPILYVNLVGGQDDLIFDGGSFAMNASAEETFCAPEFEEGLYPINFEDGQFHGSKVLINPEKDHRNQMVERVYKAITLGIKDYVNRNGFPGVLLGLSGGIDSALVAALACDALGAERVWCVSMPSQYTAGMSNDDAEEQTKLMGCKYSVLPIKNIYSAFETALADEFTGKKIDLTEENIQSRSRGVLLMALSNKFGHMVLATGNKSEMAVGYATLYGDMCGGFAPIKDAYKTLVFDLVNYRNSLGRVIPQRVIDRPPSAELRPDQKDSDSLPPYDVLDPILQAYVEEQLSIPEIIAQGFDEAVVRRVAALVRRNEYKRRQAPPGPKITARAFGRDRRYPLTAQYGDV